MTLSGPWVCACVCVFVCVRSRKVGWVGTHEALCIFLDLHCVSIFFFYCSGVVNNLKGFTVELCGDNNKKEITFREFFCPTHTHLLFIARIFIHFLAHISQNCCTTTITAATHPPPQAETSVLLCPEASFSKNMFLFQLINAFVSQFLQSTSAHFPLFTSPSPAEDAEGGIIENI